MKQRTLGLLIAVLTATIFAVSSSDLLTETTSAQKQNNRAKTVKTVLPKSKRIKKIIKGAEKPSEIPDNVAYELFLRTVANGNARGLVKRAGFDDETIETIMGEAYSLNEDLEALDRRAFELKNSREKTMNAQLASNLSDLETKKTELIERRINRFLPQSLGADKISKLRNFVQSHVKRNVQKILVSGTPKTSPVALSKYFVKSFTNKAMNSGELYLYSDAWQAETSVFGSGSLSEQYNSDTSYRATVSVTSPSGRSNTTVGDWGYATIVHDSGLSIGIEDGTYNIQAYFEEQDGYYDEYGNFYGTGSSSVGTSTDSVLVAPKVTVESVTPSLLPLRSLESGEFVATVSTTTEVEPQTVVTVEFYGTSIPQLNYSVAPQNRRQQFTVTQPGVPVPVEFQITMNSTTSAGTGTDAQNKIRIMSITPPAGRPTPTIGATEPVATIRYLGTPTPTPTPNPGGGTGCRSGFAASGEKYSEEKDSGGEEGNRCSPCNPDPQELYACTTQFQGTYDWNFCFCGQSPIVLDILGNGFNLTNPQNGVLFDITADAIKEQIAWTSPDTDDAWLALDRNQNNQIDDGKELFGNISEQPAGQNPRQGFASLGMFDRPERGGNGDGQITRRDAVFKKLRLWRDRNQNGVSEPEELFRLHALDVIAISLDYRESNRRDEHGNKFKYRAKVRDRANANVGRWAWDVFLRVQP